MQTISGLSRESILYSSVCTRIEWINEYILCANVSDTLKKFYAEELLDLVNIAKELNRYSSEYSHYVEKAQAILEKGQSNAS